MSPTLARVLALLLIGLCAGSSSVAAQEQPGWRDGLTRVETDAKDLQARVTSRNPKAAATVLAAVEAARAALAASVPLLDKVSTATDTADVASAATAVLASAQGWVPLVAAAADAAGSAVGTISTEPGKSEAAKSAVGARTAAQAVADALKQAKPLAASLTKDLPASDATGLKNSFMKQMEDAATQALAVLDASTKVAREAVDPLLDATGEGDDGVLEALRVRLTGGAILFNGSPEVMVNDAKTAATIRSSQFGQAATYLAFEAQPRLWASELGRCRTDPTLPDPDRRYKRGAAGATPAQRDCKAERFASAEARGYSRIYGDPTIAVRLTTIPVAGAKPQALTRIEAPDPTTVIQSQKAAQLQLGLLTSVNFGGFAVRNAKFHWGLGPTVRYALQSVTDSQRALRVWDLDNDLFKMPSAGLRLTLYEKDRAVGGSRQKGWASAAYLDATWGRFENFETATGKTPAAVACLANPAACLLAPVDSSEFDVQRDTRTYIEGRIFLEFIYLGVDVNTGSGPDDLRFIAGLTMTLDQFFGRRR